MAKKEQLRQTRNGTVINLTSSKQESALGVALNRSVEKIEDRFKLSLCHEMKVNNLQIVTRLRELYPTVDFEDPLANTYMKPDGGIVYIISKVDGFKYPILITEVKNQGTNDLRLKEGKKKQAKGNAIERLGKNVIGFRTMTLDEGITPFVCFGYGCDFEEGSSIIDRVRTIAMFGPLNKVQVVDDGPEGVFSRGSFYFREEEWSEDEMVKVMTDVMARSIYYYFSKYGEDFFIAEPGSSVFSLDSGTEGANLHHHMVWE